MNQFEIGIRETVDGKNEYTEFKNFITKENVEKEVLRLYKQEIPYVIASNYDTTITIVSKRVKSDDNIVINAGDIVSHEKLVSDVELIKEAKARLDDIVLKIKKHEEKNNFRTIII
jgi:hypothetical protein